MAEPATTAAPAAPAPPTPTRWQGFWTRIFWSWVLVGGFVDVLLAGHAWVVGLIFAIQVLSFGEVTSIGYSSAEARTVPWFRTINWYIFLSVNYYFYGESMLLYFHSFTIELAPLAFLAHNHVIISYTLYTAGLILFVLSLQKDTYRFQFRQLAWTHMALLFVVGQPIFIVDNLLEGLVWFILPVLLVITNDSTAYLWGFFIGRTPLIQLSPKKTWEGFIGGLVSTIVLSIVFSYALMQFEYLICPVEALHATPFKALWTTTCARTPLYTVTPYALPPFVVQTLARVLPAAVRPVTHVWLAPFQLHAIMLAVFASLVAPFGGFFASGLKRAYGIKDFGDLIPGHGGITDRFDCQFLMGLFAYIYYNAFVRVEAVATVRDLMDQVVLLPREQQLHLLHLLTEHLKLPSS
eukprot:Unigene10006_Nuclearia_a/m.30563 Unigene10006_Nuclearia_a/g.30563  ORF Unigene10006_Nuclearia_a/g.30563 Unigene10006_Nuclearia_a/m.30563 type:complete len:408 (-) Unigene10006_Nuclearia_a:311-1534(-)